MQSISVILNIFKLESAQDVDIWNCSFIDGQTQGCCCAVYEGIITIGREGVQRVVAVWQLTL